MADRAEGEEEEEGGHVLLPQREGGGGGAETGEVPGGEEDSSCILPEQAKMAAGEEGEGGWEHTPHVCTQSGAGEGIPARYIFSVLGFLAFTIMYCLRTCPNVAMVAMVNSTAVALKYTAHNNNNSSSNITTTVSHHCPGASQNQTDTDYMEGEFVWEERTQGVILGSFYYLYMPLQLLGGWVADRVRGKLLLGAGLLLSSLLSLAFPSAARAGPGFAIAVRALQGVAESTAYSAMHVLCARWVPVQERSRLVSFAYSGSEMGVVCGMLLTGLLSKYGFAGGWPSAFYVFGMLGCVWFLLWMVLVFDSPARHPRISQQEKRYIHDSVGHHAGASSTPWAALLTSAPVWAICIAHTAYNWGYFSMLTSLPTYMKQILRFHIVANGFLSALPYLLMWGMQVGAGVASDHLRKNFTTACTRKLMYTLGSIFPACLLVASGYVSCDHTLAVVLLTIGVMATGMAASTVMVNHLDFAPRFAGVLFGLSNTFATFPGFLAPLLIGVLTNHNQTIEQWRIFFYISAVIHLGSIVLFLGLGRGEVQKWAAPPPICILIPDPLPSQNVKKKDSEHVNNDERLGVLG